MSAAPAPRGQSSSTHGPGHSFSNGNAPASPAAPLWGTSANELWLGALAPAGR